MNRILIALVSVSSALSTGCAGDAFSDHPSLALGAYVDRFNSKVFVNLAVPNVDAACPRFGAELAATLNGRAMTVLSHGGEYEAYSYNTGRMEPACQTVAFEAPLRADEADAVIVVTAAGETVEASFMAMTAAPVVAWSADSDGTMRPGSTETLSYSVATDTVALWVTMIGANGEAVFSPGEIVSSGSQLSFVVPPEATEAEGFLFVALDRHPAVVSCVGLARCEAAEELSVDLPARIVR